MKTSFYFVLWMIIYPILGLFHSQVIAQNGFIFALIAVFGISWMLNRLMPETLAYEKISYNVSIMENIYTGNIHAFRERISREAMIETITSIYFMLSTAFLVFLMVKFGMRDWLSLGIFAFITFGVVGRCNTLLKARSSLKSSPTIETCIYAAKSVYNLDYNRYYHTRNFNSISSVLPPRPKYFKVFQIISLVIAIIAVILGILQIILGSMSLLSDLSLTSGAIAGIYYLYGLLAIYFGVKDGVDTSQALKQN